MRTLLSRLARVVAGLVLCTPAAFAQGRDCPPAPPGLPELKMEELARDARDRGLLWRLEKDGRVSWLYGTVHVSRPEWVVPGPRIRAALAQSDVLALELDPADPELPRAFAAPGDAARAQRVLAGLQPRVDRLAQRACLPAQALAPMRPLLQLMVISLFDGRREGFHPELGVDQVLAGMAHALGKPLVALESAAAQLAALTPASEDDERVLLARGLQDLESGAHRALGNRLMNAWLASDEAAFASYPQWCRCLDTPAEQRFFQRLNDARNPAMADRLLALHGEGRRVFAAVGALHMTGPQALPGLLRARGFSVTRVPFASTGASP